MACLCTKDPTGDFDALTRVGAAATVFIQSDDAPTATITAATFNDEPVVVDDDGLLLLPPAAGGTNVLALTIEGVEAGDDVQLVELCDDGVPSVLKRKFVGAAPGGANPVMRFHIDAS